MTIGLAAHADHQLNPRIVLCCDWLLGDALSSSERTCKLDITSVPRTAVLLTGTLETAIGLTGACRSKLKIKGAFASRESFKRAIHSALNTYLAQLAKRSRNLDDVELLLANFFSDGPCITHVNSQGVFEVIFPEIKSIGIGCHFSDPILLWRQKHQPMEPALNLPMVLYRVYEAKKLSEASRDVGRLTTLVILEANCEEEQGFSARPITESCFEWLNKRFLEFGPQPLPQQFDYVFD